MFRIISFLVLLTTLSLAQAQQKNVLFIAVDDLKPLIGAYGQTQMITPNLDRLAAMGTTFTNASCQQAVCGPSRASLLTGWYPDQTQVWDLNTLIRDKNPDVITLPQHLKSLGYMTTGAGKLFDPRSVDNDYDAVSWSQTYYHSVDDSYYDNGDSGYKGYHDPQVPIDDAAFDSYMTQNPTADENVAVKLFPKAKPTTESMDLADNAYKDGATTEYILTKIDALATGSDPFFLAAGFAKPHLPFVAPKKYWDLYDINDIQIHPFQQQPADVPGMAWRTNGEMTSTYSDVPWHKDRDLNEAEQKHLIHGYMACVSYIDAQLGRILDKLDAKGLTENTIIVLWGDHGWHLGDHNMWAKHSNFEQAVTSPLIIVDPEIGTAQQVSSSPVEFVDVFPTLCDLLNVPAPTGLEGKSLTPIMVDPMVKVREAALAQYPRTSGGKDHMGYTLRSEKFRYTKWVKMDYEAGERYGEITGYQLYDLVNDPYETVNLYDNPSYSQTVDFFEKEFKRRNIAQATPSSFLEVNTCASSFTAPDGSNYTTDGWYTATIKAKNGMDSVITIQLTLGVGSLSKEVTESNGILTATQENASYQWYACANSQPVSGATDRSFTPTTTGLYLVEVTNTCGTVSSSCEWVVVNNVLGSDRDLGIQVYPNPIQNNELYISFNQSQSQVQVDIYDVTGKLVQEYHSQEISDLELSTKNIHGVCFLRIQSDLGEVIKRVVVE